MKAFARLECDEPTRQVVANRVPSERKPAVRRRLSCCNSFTSKQLRIKDSHGLSDIHVPFQVPCV